MIRPSVFLQRGTIAILLACSNPTTPTVASIAGSYVTSYWTEQYTPTQTIDHLAAGDTIWISLSDDGTTAGRTLSTTYGYRIDFTGTWTLAAGIVRFPEPATSPLSVINFTAGHNRLSGQGQFNGLTSRWVFAK